MGVEVAGGRDFDYPHPLLHLPLEPRVVALTGQLPSPRLASVAVAALALALLGCPSGASPPGLAVAELAASPAPALPLAEVSGLAFAASPATLYAVGDEERVLLRLPWSDPVDLARAERLAIPLPDEAGGSQLEAVVVTPDGGALVLDEQRDRVHLLAFGSPGADAAVRVVHTFRLHVPADHPLAAAWADKPNRRGEGLALLPGGHLLVAKQRQPRVLVEFGPLGATPRGVTAAGLATPGPLPDALPDELFPLAVWEADAAARGHLASLSDLATTTDGALYVVVAARRGPSVGRVALPLLPSAKTFALDAAWTISSAVDGKAEGLALLPDGRAVVAFDAEAGAPNVVVLPDLVTPRR